MFRVKASVEQMTFYKLLISGMTVRQAYEHAHVSKQTGFLHKKQLEEAGYIKTIHGTCPAIFERGEYAKYLDEILGSQPPPDRSESAPLTTTVISDVKPMPEKHVIQTQILPPDSPNDGAPSAQPPSIQPEPAPESPPRPDIQPDALKPTEQGGVIPSTVAKPNKPEGIPVQEVRVHQHGYIQYDVEKVGDMESIAVCLPKQDGIELPFFPKLPYMDYHNNKRWLSKFKPLGKKWTCTIELHITPTKQLLRIFPPEVYATKTELEHVDYPERFFEDEINPILDILEAHGSWKIRRESGEAKGVMFGKPFYGLVNDEIAQSMPKGVTTLPNGEIVINDESPKKNPASAKLHGKGEIESPNKERVLGWMQSLEREQTRDEKMDTIMSTLDRTLGIIERLAKLQEAQASLFATQMGLDSTQKTEKRMKDAFESSYFG